MSIRMTALGLLAVSMAASAATAAELPGVEKCVFQSQVRGWQVIDDHTLVVDAPTSSSRYLIKLFAPTTGLNFQEQLGFEDGDHNGQLCGTGDLLLVGNPVPQRMPIIAVRLLSKDEAKALI